MTAKPRTAQGTRRGDGPRREQEVLEAALGVFSRKGYGEATIQDIADELGLLKGSLYHYIDGKEDLLFRLLVDTHAAVQEILDEVAALPDLTPIERLREYTRRQVDYTCRNMARMRVYYHDFESLSPARLADVRRQRLVHERFVVQQIEAAQRTGDVDPEANAHVMANCMFGSLIWVYRWYRPRGRLPRDELAATCADFVLRGITGPPRP